MPFGFDGSGYTVILFCGVWLFASSPMPFGFDGSGYKKDIIATLQKKWSVSNAFRL